MHTSAFRIERWFGLTRRLECFQPQYGAATSPTHFTAFHWPLVVGPSCFLSATHFGNVSKKISKQQIIPYPKTVAAEHPCYESEQRARTFKAAAAAKVTEEAFLRK